MKRLLLTIAGVALLVSGIALATATSPLAAAPGPDDPDPIAAVAEPANGFPAGTFGGAPVLAAEGWNVAANVSNSPGPSGAPVMALDSAGNVHMAWYDNIPGNWEIMYSAKAPAGPWSDAENVSRNASYSLVPAIIADHNDSVAIVWQDYGGPRIAHQGTLMYKSREPGQDFTPFIPISNTTGFGGYPEVRDPNVAVDGLNTLHLVWAGNTVTGYRIFYARKTQGGVWTTPRVVNPGWGSCYRPRMVVGAGDALHVVWQEMLAGQTAADIFYSTLPANGVWAASVNLSHNAGDSQEPYIVAGSDNTLRVVWRDNVAGADQTDIWSIYKPQGGAWSAAENISNTDGDSAGPVLVEDASGTLHLVWYDNTPGNWEILYATKPVAGSWTSGANISQTPGRSGQPDLIYDVHGKLHLAWADDTPGDFDIFYTTKVTPVFSTSYKQATATALAGENIGYTLVLRNPSPLAVTLFVTDSVPVETAYVADTAQATAGAVTVVGGEVRWTGVVPARGQVEVRFAAAVSAGAPVNSIVRNRAEVSDSSGVAISIEASTRIVLTRLVTPIILQAY